MEFPDYRQKLVESLESAYDFYWSMKDDDLSHDIKTIRHGLLGLQEIILEADDRETLYSRLSTYDPAQDEGLNGFSYAVQATRDTLLDNIEICRIPTLDDLKYRFR